MTVKDLITSLLEFDMSDKIDIDCIFRGDLASDDGLDLDSVRRVTSQYGSYAVLMVDKY